jgi:hypothetical protein
MSESNNTPSTLNRAGQNPPPGGDRSNSVTFTVTEDLTHQEIVLGSSPMTLLTATISVREHLSINK